MTKSESLTLLEDSDHIVHITPIFHINQDAKFIVRNKFRVQYKKDLSLNKIKSLNAKHNVNILRKGRNVKNNYVLTLNKNNYKLNIDALNMANLFQNLPEVEYSVPCFTLYGNFLHSTFPDDPLIDNQWHLIKAQVTNAWDISKGSSSNIIAVLDVGFDLEHEDLENKYLIENNEIVGEDFTDQGDNSPCPLKNNPHGTACAGLIAAESDNNIGVAGYDWYGKIMPLQVSYNTTDLIYWPDNGFWDPEWTTDAIDFANENGADILSMSFSQAQDPDITFAIHDAASNGRNGKGCIIVVSSGNSNSTVDYPANLDDYVIAVGATDEDDERWSYSNYGSELDVVAPSGLNATMAQGDKLICECAPEKNYSVILTRGNIWTTDLTGYDELTGSYGYHPENCYYNNGTYPSGSGDGYTGLYSGTSAAAPQVAGLASLILSVNDSLTRSQVQTIIQESADEVAGMGGSTWTQYYGHGRINAYKALKYTIENFETQNIVSGTISTNTSWSGYKYITGDVTVNSGVTLTISPGSIIFFKNYKKLIVNGTLSAQGSDSQPIKFSSINQIPSTADWYGIKINGSASLDYCTIVYADRGISFYNPATGTVSNSTFHNNSYGIYIYESAPTIENCSIHDNSNKGIYVYRNNYISGDVDIISNSINNNAYSGIYCYMSSPEIRENEISSNDKGVHCVYNSSPVFGAYHIRGNNIITNCDYGLRADYSSDPTLGLQYPGVGGWNEFENIDNYFIYAYNSCNINAEKNWWAPYPPNPNMFYAIVSSSIDYIPYLDNDPTPSKAAPSDEGRISSAGQSSTGLSAEFDETWTLKEKIDYAGSLIYLDQTAESKKICNDIIETYPDSAASVYALGTYWKADRYQSDRDNTDQQDFRDLLYNLSSKESESALYGHSEILLAGFEGAEGLPRLENVYTGYKNSYLAEIALFNKFLFYLNEKDDLTSALSVNDQLNSEYPNSLVAVWSSEHLSSEKLPGSEQSSYSAKDAPSDAGFPLEFNLFPNYPNPFNPVTTIRYDLPVPSIVNVRICNILGQPVMQYQTNRQSPGTHKIKWDGKNVDGNRAASGMYLLRFEARSLEDDRTFSKTAKLLLVR